VGPDLFNRIEVYATNGTLVASLDPTQQAYQVNGLPAGSYYVLASALFSDNVPQLYAGQPCPLFSCRQDFAGGTLVVVGAGLDTPGIDFTLVRGASVQVFVATEGAGDRVPGARVHLYDLAGSEIAVRDGAEVEFRGMLPGTYFVSAEDLSGTHRAELFDNHPCAGCPVTAGTPLLLEQAVRGSVMIRLVDSNLGFYTLQPCRLVDTRSTTPLLSIESLRVFNDFAGCGVPATAVALVVNVTAVNPNGDGELLVRANGWDLHYANFALLPVVSFRAGVTRAATTHLSIARGTGPTAQDSGFFATALIPGAGAVHVVVDVTGYYAPLP
jgi:hypothetical protein